MFEHYVLSKLCFLKYFLMSHRPITFTPNLMKMSCYCSFVYHRCYFFKIETTIFVLFLFFYVLDGYDATHYARNFFYYGTRQNKKEF